MIKRLVFRECFVAAIKGRPCQRYYFFLVAIYTFSAHFNLFGSWSGGMWPCPSVTSARVPVVNMKPRHGFSSQREDQELPPHTNTLLIRFRPEEDELTHSLCIKGTFIFSALKRK